MRCGCCCQPPWRPRNLHDLDELYKRITREEFKVDEGEMGTDAEDLLRKVRICIFRRPSISCSWWLTIISTYYHRC